MNGIITIPSSEDKLRRPEQLQRIPAVGLSRPVASHPTTPYWSLREGIIIDRKNVLPCNRLDIGALRLPTLAQHQPITSPILSQGRQPQRTDIQVFAGGRAFSLSTIVPIDLSGQPDIRVDCRGSKDEKLVESLSQKRNDGRRSLCLK